MATNLNSTIAQLTSNTNQTNFTNNQKNLGTTNLNDGDFNQLLLAQLQYQDPTSPVDDSQFLDQQAELAQVDGINSLNTTITNSTGLSEASTLIGRTVDVTDSQGNVTTGVVNGASLSNGSVGLSINGTTFTPSEVTKIYDDPVTTTSSTSGTSSGS